MINQHVRVIAGLLFAGFAGGLLVTSGPTRWLSEPTATAATDEEQPGQDARRGSSDTGHKGRQGGIGQEDGNEAAAGTARSHQGRAIAATDQDGGEDADDADTGAAPQPVRPRPHPADTRPVTLSGAEAITFLVGNTMRGKAPDGGPLDRYLSARGWRGDMQANDIVAHRWSVEGDRLCVVESPASTLCRTVTVRVEAAPNAGRGSLLGTVTIAHRKSWPVLRGNVADMPEHLPLLDAAGRQPRQVEPASATTSGRDALKALVRHPLVVDRDPEGLRGLYFEPDGRWIETRPLWPGASAEAGLRVAVGEWGFEDGALCIDRPGLDLTRRCFRPEQWGDTTFRLLPTAGRDGAQTLLVLASLAAAR